jgi:sulfonate transport system ATP-binding protein
VAREVEGADEGEVVAVGGAVGGTTCVRVDHLTKSYGSRRVLTNAHFSVADGEFVALLGRSGSGKSTILRILAGLDPDIGGDAWVPTRRAVVFQEPRLLPWSSVLDNVTLGLKGADDRQRAEDVLAEVGLEGHAGDWPKTLSGGEAQRVALARALVRQPKLLLLDEPFGALDALTRMKMHWLLKRLCLRHHPSVLLVTHDVDEAILLADRILVLTDGSISFNEAVPSTDDQDRDRGRGRKDPALVALRSVLLNELGVIEEGDAAAPGRTP